MFRLMKKYQHSIYIFITAIVIVSFSFFGASGVIQESIDFEKPSFIAVDGSSVSQSDLDSMMRFIATDAMDHKKMQRAGLNFLNDGVLVKDIFSSGVAAELIRQHPELFREELSKKLQREKAFVLYKHPELEALSTENVWQYFLPQMKGHFDKLRAHNDPLSTDYLQQKISLYLAQKQLSQDHVRQVLLYQQAQYPWLEQDPFLEQGDLSLFGYHTVEDWFGKHFLQMSAAFIINSAKIAEKQGFIVTRNEAYADLLEQNAQRFKESRATEFSNAASSSDYFHSQLQALRMDKTQVIECVRKILLARKLIQNEQMQNLVSVLPWKEFQKYAQAERKGTKYLLPKELDLTPKTYALFETYLQSISASSLRIDELPLLKKPVNELQKLFPELTQQTVAVEMKSVSFSEVLGAVSSKSLLQWQLSDSGWNTLAKEYPELSIEELSQEVRAAKLQLLEEKSRARIDQFSRKQVVKSSSEFINKALEKAPLKQYEWNLALRGGISPLEGFASSEELLHALFSENAIIERGGRYFLFSSVETKDIQAASFSDALSSGALQSLTKKVLQEHYKKTLAFSQKPFEEVEMEVVKSLYSKRIKELSSIYKFNDKSPEILKLVASYRLRPFMESARNKLITEEEFPASEWNLVKKEFTTSKAHFDEHISKNTPLPLEYSEVFLDQTEKLYFYTLNDVENYPSLTTLSEKIYSMKKKIEEEVNAFFAKRLVQEIQEKKGFTFFKEL